VLASAAFPELQLGDFGPAVGPVKSTASIAAGRFTVAVWSQPDGSDPQRLPLVLLS
jgi:hypothetical protein